MSKSRSSSRSRSKNSALAPAPAKKGGSGSGNPAFCTGIVFNSVTDPIRFDLDPDLAFHFFGSRAGSESKYVKVNLKFFKN